jgi:integrase
MSVNSQETASAYLSALVYFNTFLMQQTRKTTAEKVIVDMLKPKSDVYELLQGFISYLAPLKLAASSKRMFVRAVRSYLGFYGIDIIPSKFKTRVKMFKVPKEYGEALDIETIRILLTACNNRRLKSFLLCSASGGFRVRELAAVRHKDIDWDKSPVKILVRAEYTKMRTAREVYISDEAARHLKQWVDWQHREDKYKRIEYNANGLVFSVRGSDTSSPSELYKALNIEWHKVLVAANLNQKRDNMTRRCLTLHVFRSFTKSQLSDHANSDYREWFLGHSASSYYRRSE